VTDFIATLPGPGFGRVTLRQLTLAGAALNYRVERSAIGLIGIGLKQDRNRNG
jgi:hypothetical protein